MTPQPVLSSTARVELFVAAAFVAFFLYVKDDLAARLAPQAPAVSAIAPCREPTEHEQLLVPHVLRDGRLVPDGCLYAASQSAYPKKPRPKVAHAKAHD